MHSDRVDAGRSDELGRAHRRSAAVVAALPLLIAAAGAQADDWGQWGRDPQHAGQSSASGQRLESILARTEYDPFVSRAIAESGGGLLAHYPVPLLDGASVYSLIKEGSYVACSPVGSGQPFPCGPDALDGQSWGMRRLDWRDGALVEVWRFTSDWKPVPNSNAPGAPAGGLADWEPVYQPALAGDSLYMPGADGSVLRVARSDGHLIARLTPFGFPASGFYVAGGLAADAQGNVYYNAISLQPGTPWSSDARGGFLVRVSADGSVRAADFSTLVPGAPAATAQCRLAFANSELPWPPSPSAVPASAACGRQRPGINAVPAIAPDGSVYTVSRAHNNPRYSFLIATSADLQPRWARSLRDLLADGCNVLLPPNGTPGGCRSGAATGVDPATNERPAGQVTDLSSASPVVLPDGNVVYGAYTRYNGSRGHLLRFSPAGQFLSSYDFGWDSTPAVARHGSTFSVIIKDNHYGAGYCGSAQFCPATEERYDVTSLDPSLRPEWHFTATNTMSCARQPDGSVVCRSDHPAGFEWCVNQPAIDAAGVVYANSEDGALYAINPDGTLRDALFLESALGAAYTPLSIGADGLVYSQNYGVLFAVGARR